MTSPRTQALLKVVLLVLFLGVAVWLLFCTGAGQFLRDAARPDGADERGQIRDWIASFDPIAAPIVYIAIYIVGTILLVPGTLLSFVGAMLFGAYFGTLYTWIGATIGATLSFLLAKWLGRDFVDQLFGGRFAEFEERVEHHGFTSLLILRLLPWFPFTGINFGSGLTRIRFRDYVLATAIGILPGTFVYQLLFAKLQEKVLSKEWQWSDLADWELGMAIGLFVIFAWLGGRLARRIQTDEHEPPRD